MAKRKEDKISNFLPVNRKFFKHPFWKEKRTFSKSEAWLWLIAEARFEESQATELIGGKLVSWSRGQLPASVRHLADKWEWSKGKVEDFLNVLEKKMYQITRHQDAGQTIITLCNYELYNGFGQQNGQQSGHRKQEQHRDTDEEADIIQDSKADTGRTVGGHGADETNKDNKEKKGKNDGEAPPAHLYGSAISKSIEELKVDCLKDKVYFVEYLMRLHKISEYQVTKALEDFNERLMSIGEPVKTVKDYRTHFQSWLPKQDMKKFRLNPQEQAASNGINDTLNSIGL